MERFVLSIVINRPIEEVFKFLTNLENDLNWRSEWVDATNTSGCSFCQLCRSSNKEERHFLFPG